MTTCQALRQKFAQVWPHLDEPARRLVAASAAVQLGYGGISQVSRSCGLSRVTITKGVQQLNAAPLPAGRLRRPGAGRPSLVKQDPDLLHALESLVEPLTRGDPESPLRWTCKSTRALAAELTAQHHPVSHEKVAQFLRQMEYSLQSSRKTEEGQDHPDRDAQFQHINQVVQGALAQGGPVISVDTKKKELIGNYENRDDNGERSSRQSTSTSMIFLIPRYRVPIPMGFMTWAATAVSLTALIMTPQPFLWLPSVGGCAPKPVGSIPRPNSCCSPPMVAAAMGIACAYGKWNCKSWRMRRGWPSKSATSRPAPANGTRWNIAYSRSSRPTGGESPSATMKPWSN